MQIWFILAPCPQHIAQGLLGNQMKSAFPPTPNYPFPPNGKPVPWTSRQEKAYQKAMREKAPLAPF
jgi:hypothetical protein